MFEMNNIFKNMFLYSFSLATEFTSKLFIVSTDL